MPGEFKAVYVSRKRVHIGSWIRRTRKLFALDCKFTYLDGSRSFVVRIHADNPVVKGLQVRTVYRFEAVGHVGFKAMKDVVTDLESGTVYRMVRA